MSKNKYPRSVAKFIRTEKALIRRKTQDKVEQNRLIRELISRIGSSRVNA